jgi:hypothetical protein
MTQSDAPRHVIVGGGQVGGAPSEMAFQADAA